MKKKRTVVILCALLISVLVTGTVIAATAGDTSKTDLLVTQSYVDSKITQARQDIKQDAYEAVRQAVDEAIKDHYSDDVRTIVTDLVKNDAQLRQSLLKTVGGLDVGFETVQLKKGEKLTGTCEFILRSGSAVTVCPGTNGINDMTNGTDIAGGKSVILNHYCAIPRDDGRAIKATASSYVMVRGEFRITK